MAFYSDKELAALKYINDKECVDDDLLEEYMDTLNDVDNPHAMDDPKFEDLVLYSQIDMDMYNDTFTYGGSEYLILTDSEADDKWDNALEDYIDECIIPEIPEDYQIYFDREKWKRDARHDGRGHSIATYDGDEDEVEYNGETYYIYRMN